MFKMFCTLATFVAGGWLALRVPEVAEFVNTAAVKFFDFVIQLKELSQ